MRKVLAKTKSAGKVSEALRGLQIEGGPAGMMRVLYEVSAPGADWWLVTLVVGHRVCSDGKPQACETGCSAVESGLDVSAVPSCSYPCSHP